MMAFAMLIMSQKSLRVDGICYTDMVQNLIISEHSLIHQNSKKTPH